MPDTPPLPKLTLDDLFGPTVHHDVVLEVEQMGKRGLWQVRARQPTNDEIARIMQKYRRTDHSGNVREDPAAAQRELVKTILYGPGCDPPLTNEQIDSLPPPFVKALIRHFGLDEESKREKEGALGKSDQP